jgi:hypothetical protein
MKAKENVDVRKNKRDLPENGISEVNSNTEGICSVSKETYAKLPHAAILNSSSVKQGASMNVWVCLYIVTCRVGRATKMTGSTSDNWIY